MSGQFPECLDSFQNVRLFQTIRKVWKASTLSRQFSHCPEYSHSFRTVSKLSGQFPDCPETFQTDRTVFRLSRWFPDYQPDNQDGLDDFHTFQAVSPYPENFHTFWTLRKLSGKFPHCPDSCQTFWLYLETFWINWKASRCRTL